MQATRPTHPTYLGTVLLLLLLGLRVVMSRMDISAHAACSRSRHGSDKYLNPSGNLSLPLATAIYNGRTTWLQIKDDHAMFVMHPNVTGIACWCVQHFGERYVASVVHQALAKTDAALMLDVGANAGYFGLLSLALGAHVVFFDPLPQCQAYIMKHIDANGFHTRAHLVGAALAATDEVNASVDITSVASVCDGGFSLKGGMLAKSSRRSHALSQAGREAPAVPAVPAETAVPAVPAVLAPVVGLADRSMPWVLRQALASSEEERVITMVKIDVNGAELEVLRLQFLPLLRRRRIEHLVVEWNPHEWHR